MKRDSVGELEELVLLAVGAAYEDAYAVNILNIIRDEANRIIDVTAIHSVLRRLEDKGYVKSQMGGATQERGGRRKRIFTLTHAGRQVLEENMIIRTALYNKMPKLTFSGFSI